MNMNLVDHAKRLMTNFGASWVMWLLLGLSVVSVAIMLERGWFYYSLRDDLGALARSFGDYLRRGEVKEAQRLLENSPSAEAAVVVAGLVEAPRGAEAAEEAMAGAAALQRMKLEKRLVFLGTLGNNAPFVGLLGTVIGIVQAFDELGKAAKTQAAGQAAAQAASAIAPQTVMTSIAEALVATAIGLLVAIPAVAAYNMFQRLTKSTLANTEVLTRILLAHLKAVPAEEQAS
ncbi:MAG TPA: MotA/TolQ/ExbB proton channel family protein [Polyangiaceae bacterium]|nr:MotA/TolQ/ExbB proton channel family protein [Polyangiaceae bacterium]